MNQSKRILVVEDLLVFALELEDDLREAGYEVVGPVSDLDSAIELAEREPVDAALLDINLKGGLVFPLARRLARKNTPFLFLTGYSPETVIPREFSNAPCLEKPVIGEALLVSLSRLLENNQRRVEDAAVANL